MERVRSAIRVRHFSRRTEEAYTTWIRRFIVFHGKRHSSEMGAAHVAEFLSALATDGHVSASTQNQALCAVLFLYRRVLGMELGAIEGVVRATAPRRLPVVMTPAEVGHVLSKLAGVYGLIGTLMYGASLRLREVLELRVKDLDFERRQIVVREGKGRKDRVTPLAASVIPALKAHVERVQAQHQRDVAQGLGAVTLPDALAKKYPTAATSWPWQFVFPAARICRDPRWGRRLGFTSMSLRYSVPLLMPCGRPPSVNARHATLSGIRLRRTCSRPVTTSGPFRSCSGTPT